MASCNAKINRIAEKNKRQSYFHPALTYFDKHLVKIILNLGVYVAGGGKFTP